MITGYLMKLVPNAPDLLFSDHQYFSVPDDFYDQDRKAVAAVAARRAAGKLRKRKSVSARGVSFDQEH